MTYNCPAGCGGGPFDSEHAAVMHGINSKDDTHSHLSSWSGAYTALLGSEESGSEDNSEDISEDNSEGSERLEFPVAPGGPNPLEASGAEESDSVDLELPEPEPPEPSSKIVDSGGSGAGLLVAASGAVVIAALIGRNVLASGGSTNEENSLPVV